MIPRRGPPARLPAFGGLIEVLVGLSLLGAGALSWLALWRGGEPRDERRDPPRDEGDDGG